MYRGMGGGGRVRTTCAGVNYVCREIRGRPHVQRDKDMSEDKTTCQGDNNMCREIRGRTTCAW